MKPSTTASRLRALRIRTSGVLVPSQTLRHNSISTRPGAAESITPLRSILIANRGEIALRVRRTAAEAGIRTTTLYTDPDRKAQHALSSPFAVNLGSTDQYLNGSRIVHIAKEQGCEAIHPGYGFLSENAEFARQCTEAGLVFIGPPSKAIESMGDKARSKDIMTRAGVPCIPGYHGAGQEPALLADEAAKIGYPVLLKAVKGGGGKGMRIASSADDFHQQLESAKSEARSSFGDDVMLVEKYVTTPRHIEVQVFADKHGGCVALGERDCSIQRRHQKILEESPAPNLPEAVRQDLWEKARKAALAVGYEGAGTVEFIFDNDTGSFFFMEMNTRLQVEHPVTEMVTGLDLVHWQILVAQGHPLPLSQDEVHDRIRSRGHAVEARIYAEDPSMDFIPATGVLHHLRTPDVTDSVRIDAGFVEGDEVSPHYDPMLAKLIVSGPDRRSALQKLERALEQYEVGGVVTNIEFLKRCARSPAFVRGEVETGFIQKHRQELLSPQEVPAEAWAQAAIGLYEAEQRTRTEASPSLPLQAIGFNSIPQPSEFHLIQHSSDPSHTAKPVRVRVLKTGPDTFRAAQPDSDAVFTTTSTYDPRSRSLTSFYPHARLASTLVPIPATSPSPTAPQQLALFQQGTLHRLAVAPAPWAATALGAADDPASSVRAPMPCKVLRVDVGPGDRVSRGQALVVVESMKMETVIRAPADAVVKRVVRRPGEMAKAGVALVEFEDDDDVDDDERQ